VLHQALQLRRLDGRHLARVRFVSPSRLLDRGGVQFESFFEGREIDLIDNLFVVGCIPECILRVVGLENGKL